MSTAPLAQLPEGAQATFSAESQASAAMRRLPFRLQDFTRISWASDAAREVWQARIGRISNAWLEIEWLAVVAGLRSCSITTVSPEQFLERAPPWAQNGLAALPIAMGGVTASYSSTPVAVEPGKPFTFRMVLGAPQDVTRFKQAWDASDDRGIGTLLGYPNCCREFFKRVWVDEAMVDTTWPMALATPGAKEEGDSPHLPERPSGCCAQMGAVPFFPPWYATDNGFSTVAAMDRAHEPIVKAANPVLAERSGMVLDLGCGNGALLKKLLEANASIVPFGIDVDAGRIAHARELLPQVADNFVAGNLFDVESVWPEGRRYTLALVMPGRLLETTPDRAAQLRARLQQQCDRILIYAYGDWLTRYGSLAGLAAAAGFRLVDAIDGLAAGFAEVIGPDVA